MTSGMTVSAGMSSTKRIAQRDVVRVLEQTERGLGEAVEEERGPHAAGHDGRDPDAVAGLDVQRGSDRAGPNCDAW